MLLSYKHLVKKMHNKSVMFARKKTRAGTVFHAAPTRPIHWRQLFRRDCENNKNHQSHIQYYFYSTLCICIFCIGTNCFSTDSIFLVGGIATTFSYQSKPIVWVILIGNLLICIIGFIITIATYLGLFALVIVKHLYGVRLYYFCAQYQHHVIYFLLN